MRDTNLEEAPRAAVAVPQLPGKLRPSGSVLYVCAGENEHGRPCGKLMFVWVPPAPREQVNGHLSLKHDHGRIEVKCRRCKTLNYILLDADPA